MNKMLRFLYPAKILIKFGRRDKLRFERWTGRVRTLYVLLTMDTPAEKQNCQPIRELYLWHLLINWAQPNQRYLYLLLTKILRIDGAYCITEGIVKTSYAIYLVCLIDFQVFCWFKIWQILSDRSSWKMK